MGNRASKKPFEKGEDDRIQARPVDRGSEVQDQRGIFAQKNSAAECGHYAFGRNENRFQGLEDVAYKKESQTI
jgi:hypothetical protein